MMHQWESLQKLIKNWENQEVKDPLVYQIFEFKMDEWDNVPPVIPRFQFYIQNCLQKSIEIQKILHDRQTTADLKIEVNIQFEKYRQDLLQEEKARIQDIQNATARKDDIQRQINEINQKTKEKEEYNYKIGQEDLKLEQYLNLDKNFSQQESTFKQPTFEETDELIDWKSQQFHQPRALTIKNVRDIFFALLNQSKAQNRICDLEENVRNLWKKTELLTFEDDRLDKKINKTRQDLDNQHYRFHAEFKQFEKDTGDNFSNHSKQIRNNTELLKNHGALHDDIKVFREKQIQQNEKVETRMQKNKDFAKEETIKLKEDLNQKIEDIEKNHADYIEENARRFNEQKILLQTEIANLNDKFQKQLKEKIDALQQIVKQETERVNKNNDGIYDRYDKKLKTIKDVCAQYFSKYEKHLINHQQIVKDLERHQEQWVEMLIKPQELNQARLYAIETRIRENESNKLKDFDFVKETIKKLIYAIEQAQISTVKQTDVVQKIRNLSAKASKIGPDQRVPSIQGSQLPTLIKAKHQTQGTHSRTNTHGNELNYSTGVGFFGQSNQGSALLQTNKNIELKEIASPPLAIEQKAPSTSQILFLKRLLYLKASIDNEQTLNSMAVPFVEEIARDKADPEQLMIDSQAIISGRNTKQNNLPMMIENGGYQIQEYMPQSSQDTRFKNYEDQQLQMQISNNNLELMNQNNLEYDRNNEFKKVQTAIPQKKRRNVMTKSQNHHQESLKINRNSNIATGNKDSSTLANTLIAKIEQAKYMTEKDKEQDRKNFEQIQAQQIIRQIQNVEPFGDIPENAIKKINQI